MKTFYQNATLRRLILLCLLATAWLSALIAQDTTATRMHEVGLQISNFKLENFGLIYKVQRRTQENSYTRYGFTFTNLSYDRKNILKSAQFTGGLAANIGKETRVRLNDRVQFLHGPQFGTSFRYSLSDPTGDGNTYQNFNANLSFGFLIGIQYNFNDDFYINLETIPSLYIGNSWITSYLQEKKQTISEFNANAGFNSDAVALTVAYRFGVARK